MASKRDADRGKAPLWRKVNTTARGARRPYSGGQYRWDRRTKEGEAKRKAHTGMIARQRGRDYTPLYRFLLSRIGRDWTEVHSEAVSRLDDPEAVYHIVARTDDEKQAYHRCGESSFFSGLYIDEDGRLALVDPTLGPEHLEPWCGCCTHTLNGVPFGRAYQGRPGGDVRTDAPRHVV